MVVGYFEFNLFNAKMNSPTDSIIEHTNPMPNQVISPSNV